MRKIYIGFIIVSFAINSFSQERGFIAKRLEAKDHIALIIGNSNYSDAPLNNPENDATDVAKTFSDMGFIVEKVLDADKETMALAIDRFSKKLTTAKAAVFYYAGHGVQVNGENYLIPIGKTIATQITDESQIPYRAINAGEVLAAMEQAKVNFALVVLDACRNNPFKGTGRGRVPGLASINAPIGSLVMYATKAGATAADGEERNSPFTRAFLTHITTPGLDVNLLPSRITQTVVELTNGEQVPGTYMQLKSSFTFIPELTADEEKTIKEAQLKNLKVFDAEIIRKEQEIAQKKKLDDEALTKKQAEIQLLDKQIAELKSKISLSNNSTAETDLDKMLAFVKQKEAQKKELEDLKKKAEENRIKRERELYNIKLKEYKKLDNEISKDIEKYNQIVNSEFGVEISKAAWENLLLKYGVDKQGVNLRDLVAFKQKANPHPNSFNSVEYAGIVLNFISGSEFLMGSKERGDEIIHNVYINSFYIMQYEVTFEQYDAFCVATNRKMVNDNGWGRGKQPIINVSWSDANEYAEWLSKKTGKLWRLPTEAEWEYAAKSWQDFYYSGSKNLDEIAWYASNSSRKPHSVGQKQPNGFGLYDMTGNVMEWCSDWYDKNFYKDSPLRNPRGPLSGTFKTIRGGSWFSSSSDCGITKRDSNGIVYKNIFTGFRLVLEL